MLQGATRAKGEAVPDDPHTNGSTRKIICAFVNGIPIAIDCIPECRVHRQYARGYRVR